LDFRAFRALQVPHDILVGDADSGDVHRVDTDDLVTGKYAHGFGRSSAQGRDHHDCIVENPEFNPDAVKVAAQVFIGALPVAGRDVGRMRIELRQHILERFFNQVTRVHLVYVRLLNVGKYFPEFPDLRVDIRLLSLPECGAHAYPRRPTCKEDARKPDLTLCIRKLHTRIMSYYLWNNEITRK